MKDVKDIRAAMGGGALDHEPRRPESWRSNNDAQKDLPCFMPQCWAAGLGAYGTAAANDCASHCIRIVRWALICVGS